MYLRAMHGGPLIASIGGSGVVGWHILLGALFLPRREPGPRRSRGRSLVALAGLVLGTLLWHVAPKALVGDTPFHLARVRKLVELGSLTPGRLDELVGGGLHPGYAFPLWHAFLAAVSKLAGVDPALVLQHESALLVPLAALVAFEAGAALFGSSALGAAPATRQLLVPAVLALVFAYVRKPDWRLAASIAVAAIALVLVHPTYAVFLCIPLAGWLVADALARGRHTWRVATGLGAVALPAGAVSLALLPIARDTVSHEPSAAALQRSLAHYRDQLVVDGTSYHLAPQVFGRNGAIAVAALILVPFAGLAWRRRWGPFVLGGSLAVLAVMLVPFLFERFSDAVSLSQSRRAAGFLPFAFSFVGGVAVLTRLLAVFALPLALLAGVVFQLLWPGDFGFRLENGGPGHATWFAVAGGALALVAAPLVARRVQLDFDRRDWLAAVAAGLFVLPVAVHGFTHWSTATTADPQALTPGLIRALREDVPERGVVFSDPETSYRIAAAAPVLIVAAPVEHVADTKQNRPRERKRATLAFDATGDLAIPRRYHAQWLVVARFRRHPTLALRPVYRDARFVLYRL